MCRDAGDARGRLKATFEQVEGLWTMLAWLSIPSPMLLKLISSYTFCLGLRKSFTAPAFVRRARLYGILEHEL